jgi:hypothetical protein
MQIFKKFAEVSPAQKAFAGKYNKNVISGIIKATLKLLLFINLLFIRNGLMEEKSRPGNCGIPDEILRSDFLSAPKISCIL